MKFPCWSDYDSVYDGVDLEIHIVDHCNLNCAGCNHFCPLAEPYYITPEYLKEQLEMVKEKIPSIKWLMLLGGEPTIHPQLLELCQIARKIFPDIPVEILTNGKDLTNIIKNKKELEKLDIQITLAQYDIEYNQNDVDEVLAMKNAGISWGRESFDQTLVDVTGSQDMNETFFKNCHHQLPCFTLRDYKIYECPFAAHIIAFKKKFNVDIPEIEGIDYLNLKTLTLDQLEEFSYKPKNICKYCKPGSQWVWHKSNRSYEEFTMTMKELFFEKYEEYLSIIDLKDPSKNEKVVKIRDPNFGEHISQLNDVKYNGKVDIIIPFKDVSNELCQKLKESLKSQTIIKDCVIYLISDNSPDLKLVYDMFQDKDLNVVFLRNTEGLGPGATRNYGIKYSYNPYIFFLDFDDEFFSPNTLEKVYNTAINFSADSVFGNRIEDKSRKLLEAEDVLVRRKFIEENNILYGEWSCHEDKYFQESVKIESKRKIIMGDPVVIYNTIFINKISNTMYCREIAFNKIYANYKLVERFYLNQNIAQARSNLEDLLNFEKFFYFYNQHGNIALMNEKEKKEFEEVKLFYFYILLLINDNFIPVDNLNYIWTKIINFNLIPLKNYEDKDFYSQIDKLLNSLTEKPETQNLAKKMLLKLERK